MNLLAPVCVCVATAIGCQWVGGAERTSPSSESPSTGPRSVSTFAPPAGTGAPLWQVRIPDQPGTPVLTWVAGPVREGPMVLVGSSAIGVVQLRVSDGVVAAQYRDDGAVVRFRAQHGTGAERDPDLQGRIIAFGSQSVRVTRRDVSRLASDDPAAPSWSYAFGERTYLGVADPVLVGDIVALVADDALIGLSWDTGDVAWRAPGRYAHARGSLSSGSDQLRAVALAPGPGPVWLDKATGQPVRRAEAGPAGQVLAADWANKGALVVVIRLDSSLLRDAVFAFDAGGQLQWRWDLPRPDEPRVDPVGVLTEDEATFVFYDGRYAVRLATP
jgi:hypothetical protein